MKLSNDLSVFDGQFQWYNKRVESADMFTAKSQSKLSTDFYFKHIRCQLPMKEKSRNSRYLCDSDDIQEVHIIISARQSLHIIVHIMHIH